MTQVCYGCEYTQNFINTQTSIRSIHTAGDWFLVSSRGLFYERIFHIHICTGVALARIRTQGNVIILCLRKLPEAQTIHFKGRTNISANFSASLLFIVLFSDSFTIWYVTCFIQWNFKWITCINVHTKTIRLHRNVFRRCTFSIASYTLMIHWFPYLNTHFPFVLKHFWIDKYFQSTPMFVL